jgi:hypothetical protein
VAVKAFRVTVGTTPTRLDVYTEADKVNDSSYASLRGDGHSLLTRPRGASIFVGGADVTATTGFEQLAEEAIGRDLKPGDALYGIVASGSVVVHGEQDGV